MLGIIAAVVVAGVSVAIILTPSIVGLVRDDD